MSILAIINSNYLNLLIFFLLNDLSFFRFYIIILKSHQQFIKEYMTSGNHHKFCGILSHFEDFICYSQNVLHIRFIHKNDLKIK